MEQDYLGETPLPQQQPVWQTTRNGKVAPLVSLRLPSKPQLPLSAEELFQSALNDSLISYELEQFSRNADAELEVQVVAISIKTAQEEAQLRGKAPSWNPFMTEGEVALDVEIRDSAIRIATIQSKMLVLKQAQAQAFVNEWKPSAALQQWEMNTRC